MVETGDLAVGEIEDHGQNDQEGGRDVAALEDPEQGQKSAEKIPVVKRLGRI